MLITLKNILPQLVVGGNSCRFIRMMDESITNRDDDRPCIFIHPCETHEEYYKRTNRYAPNIPSRLLSPLKIDKGSTYNLYSSFRVPRCTELNDTINICLPKIDLKLIIDLASEQGWKNVTHSQSFKDF